MLGCVAGSLGKRPGPGFWKARAASALPAPLRAPIEAWILQPDRGSYEKLLDHAERALTEPGDEVVPSSLTGPTREAMTKILERLTQDLHGPEGGQVRTDALSNGPAWSARFVQAPELIGTVLDQEEDLRGYSQAFAAVLANGVRDWFTAEPATLAEGVGALIRGQTLAADDTASARASLLAFTRIERDSERMLESIGAEFAGVRESPDEPHPLFVHRELQSRIVDHIMSGQTDPLIVAGEAGFGKTSLLWGTARELAATLTHRPILVSAALLAGVAKPGEERATRGDIVAYAESIASQASKPVVLLDTADLLLHSSASVLATIELVEELRTLRVAIILAVRPAEAEKLPSQIKRVIVERYSERELGSAVRSLASRYLPDHAPENLVDLIKQAHVRQLPVLEVLQSPLLLRLLFELSDGLTPSMDMDVTSLYRRYWRDRIETDKRDRDTQPTPSEDLTTMACRVGLAMLAEGSPDVEVDLLLETTIQVAFSADVIQPSEALQALIGRGTLLRVADRIRFFHQTLFEFAAAQALLRRPNPEAELERLLLHVLHQPLDLFVGAVLEQFLILLSSSAARREAVTKSVNRLLDSDAPTAIQLGVAVCAHNSALAEHLTARLEALPTPALRRFLILAPQIQGTDIVEALSRIWNSRRGEVMHEFIRCVGRIAQRDPLTMGALAQELDLIEAIISEAPDTLSNPAEIYYALFALTKSCTPFVQKSILRIFDAAPGSEPLIKLLQLAGEHWEALGGNQFYDLLEIKVRLVFDSRENSPTRSVRNALGIILDLERRRADLLPLEERLLQAQRLLASVGSVESSIKVGAELVALQLEIQRVVDVPQLERFLDVVFEVSAASGPPRIVGLLIAPLLSSESPGRTQVIDRIRGVLNRGLPSRDNASGLTNEQHWAIAVRRSLIDQRVLPDVAAECLTGVDGSDHLAFWLAPDFGLPILPVAATGGHSGAILAVESITEDPSLLDASAKRTYLERATQHSNVDVKVARSAVSIALAGDVVGSLQEMARQPGCFSSLEASRPEIESAIAKHIAGNDSMQRHGVTLWESFQNMGILSPGVDELSSAVSIVRSDIDKARLTRMTAIVVRNDPAQAHKAMKWLNESDLPRGRALLDAQKSVHRAIIGSHGPMNDWPTLLDLSFQPRLSGSASVEPSMLHDASTFIRRHLETGAIQDCLAAFLDVCKSISDLPVSRKQRSKLATVFHGVGISIISRASVSHVGVLMSRLDEVPRTLAEVVVRSALLAPTGRSAVEHALSDRLLPPDIAQYAALKLNTLPREAGSGSMPAILDFAR